MAAGNINKKPKLEPEYAVVDDSPHDLNCSICLGLLVEPIQTPNCGHLFCRGCLLRWIGVNRACPSCGEHIDRNFKRTARIDRHTERLVLQTNVRCSLCAEVMVFTNWEEHSKSCLIPCRFQKLGCSEQVKNNGRREHESAAAGDHLALVAANVSDAFADLRAEVKRVQLEANFEIVRERSKAKDAIDKVLNASKEEIAQLRRETAMHIARLNLEGKRLRKNVNDKEIMDIDSKAEIAELKEEMKRLRQVVNDKEMDSNAEIAKLKEEVKRLRENDNDKEMDYKRELMEKLDFLSCV